MKDLIQQATAFAESGASFTGAEVRLWVGKLTDALERLTAGDVSLPEQDHVIHVTDSETIDCFRADQLQDYGNRRAAAATAPLLDKIDQLQAERDALKKAVDAMVADGWLHHGPEGMSDAQKAVNDACAKIKEQKP
jgi:hypothetical protein